MIVAHALETVAGDTSDEDVFLQAIRNVRFRGPMNEVRFHLEAQGVITTVLVRRVEKLSNGTLGSVVLDEYPSIDALSF